MSISAGFTAGSGPDVVLLHGLGSRWQIFAPVLEDLSATHRVHAIDLPGFGAEPEDAALRPGVTGLADWVTDVILRRGIQSPHVVGNSLGGAIALELGRRGVASRVTAFAPAGFGSPVEREWTQTVLTLQRTLARRIPDRLAAALHTTPGRGLLLSLTFGHPTRVDPDAAIADMRALAAAPAFEPVRVALRTLAPIAPNHRVPTVIVWGRRDVILPFLTQSRRARRVHPGALHITLGGAGHVPFPDSPITCAALIRGDHPFVSARKAA